MALILWLLLYLLTVCSALVSLQEISHSGHNAASSALESRNVVRPIWTHQIRCLGKTPQDIRLPEGLDSIADMTVRQFCAKENYGGTAFRHYRGIGAYCAWPVVGYENLIRRLGDVIIRYFVAMDPGSIVLPDISVPGRVPPRLLESLAATHRSMFCSRRCRCLSNIRDSRAMTTGIPAPEVLASEATPHAPYDVNPVFPMTADRGIRLDYLKERAETHEGISLGEFHSFSVPAPLDAIIPRCGNGPPSPWDLPRPFEWGMFEDLSKVCLAQTHGGSVLGNAGFICEGKGRRAELVPKEWLAHPSLLWFNSRRALALDIWCRSFCTCNVRSRSAQLKSIVLPTSNGGKKVIATISDDQIVVANEGESGKIITESFQKSTNAYGTDDSIASCGRTCSRFADCAESIQDSCRCVVNPSMSQIAAVGLGPFLPSKGVSHCFPYGLGLQTSQSKQGGWDPLSDLNGRSLDDSGSVCACNSTFASSRCCDTPDGIVWEDSRANLM